MRSKSQLQYTVGWLALGFFLMLPVAFAQVPDGENSLQVQTGDLAPGMSADHVIRLFGRHADTSDTIGAACGMLEVMTWEQEGIRIITNDGAVSSVVDLSASKAD